MEVKITKIQPAPCILLTLFLIPNSACKILDKRGLSSESWFSKPINTIIFILLIFAVIMIVFIILLVYKASPSCRNWFKGLFRRKKSENSKDYLQRDLESYIQRKKSQKNDQLPDLESGRGKKYTQVDVDSQANEREGSFYSEEQKALPSQNSSRRNKKESMHNLSKLGKQESNNNKKVKFHELKDGDTDREIRDASEIEEVDFQEIADKKRQARLKMHSSPKHDLNGEGYDKTLQEDYRDNTAYFNKRQSKRKLPKNSNLNSENKLHQDMDEDQNQDRPVESSEELYDRGSYNSFKKNREKIAELMLNREKNISPDLLQEEEDEDQEIYTKKSLELQNKKLFKIMNRMYSYLKTEKRMDSREEKKDEKFHLSTISSTPKSDRKEKYNDDPYQNTPKRQHTPVEKDNEGLEKQRIEKKPQNSFKEIRKQILEQKKNEKRLAKQKKKELIELKNSSNGSISGNKNNTPREEEIDPKTQKMIERIEALQKAKEKQKEHAKLEKEESKNESGSLKDDTVNSSKNCYSDRKPPKPNRPQKREKSTFSPNPALQKFNLKESPSEKSRSSSTQHSKPKKIPKKKIKILSKSKIKRIQLQPPQSILNIRKNSVDTTNEIRLQVPDIKIARLSDETPKEKEIPTIEGFSSQIYKPLDNPARNCSVSSIKSSDNSQSVIQKQRLRKSKSSSKPKVSRGVY
ncbi:unnamed protein product [Moneuplotes crassus]|uniref:Uncharacterized protein n=1 Tax=Euplotes crassus TaxID=5936 RepID=A0AAD2DB73_EUPCR|nr:unnamed protein product [Moneuplotes crassus]